MGGRLGNKLCLTIHMKCIFLPDNTDQHRHSQNPERHGCRNRRARRKTVQGAAGQAGHDVRAVDGEGEVGVAFRPDRFSAEPCVTGVYVRA
jgi:hypothetical protein